MTKSGWEHFSHEADIGIRGFGDSRAAAFEQAAVALMAIVVEPDAVSPDEMIEIECEAPDEELLLVDWLNALVYEMATRKLLFHRFKVRIDGTRLYGKAWGEKVDVARHKPVVEIKGATYTEVKVCQQEDGRCCAQTVVDV